MKEESKKKYLRSLRNYKRKVTKEKSELIDIN